MELRRCSREEIERIYAKYLVVDFPKDEVKPLSRIFMLLDRDLYFAYALYDERETLLAYAFFSCAAGCEYVLMDYLAVAQNMRGTGIGTQMLTLLKAEICKQYRGIILETENPDFAEDTAAFSVRTRRVRFYLRNGFLSTKMLSRLFGVEYCIFVYAEKTPSTLSLAYAVVDLYRTLIHEKYLKEHVHLRIEELI